MDATRVILVAEDSEDDVDLLKIAFRRLAIRNPLQIVTDGQQAVDYMSGIGKFSDRRQYPIPAIIFLDLKMPRKTGLEVLEWLGTHPQYRLIPSLVFTSSSQESDIRRAYELGANSFMVKPGALDQLVESIRACLDFWNRCSIPPL